MQHALPLVKDIGCLSPSCSANLQKEVLNCEGCKASKTLHREGREACLRLEHVLILGVRDVVDVAIGTGLEPRQELVLDGRFQPRGRLRLCLPPPFPLFRPV